MTAAEAKAVTPNSRRDMLANERSPPDIRRLKTAAGECDRRLTCTMMGSSSGGSSATETNGRGCEQTDDSERKSDGSRPAHGVGEWRRHDLMAPLIYPRREREKPMSGGSSIEIGGEAMPSDRNRDDRRRCRRHDLNVPLPPQQSKASSSSSSSSNNGRGRRQRRQLAHACQARLHRLGYHEIAFVHTSYNGRLKSDRDDADFALPWSDLLITSSSSDGNGDEDGDGGGEGAGRMRSFGRQNSLGMRIYRRLNIVIEEVSDVSRILLSTPNIGSTSSLSSSSLEATSSVTTLLGKYDVVSLQPMNEPALQGICDLLPTNHDDESSSSSSATKNNVHFVDIIVLEYATGSRGGYGLPYKLRKEYIERAIQAGVTYGTAMLDMKRRQGFLRTLIDFQSAYNGIQKKHTILNGKRRQLFHHHCEGGSGGRNNRPENIKMDTKFPLLLSSGSRQDYTRGTDEGLLGLRTPQDVAFFLRHLVGGAVGESRGGCNFIEDAIDDCDVVGAKSNKKRGHFTVVTSAERVLARAHDRAMGVVFVAAYPHGQGNKRSRKLGGGGGSRTYVVGDTTERSGNEAVATKYDVDDEDEDEDEDGKIIPHATGSFSLIDWLSASRDGKTTVDTEDEIAARSVSANPPSIPLERTIDDSDTAAGKASSPSTNNRIQIAMGIGDIDGIRIDPNEDHDVEDDLEDGYIAMYSI
ncbi:hypothetical protein ACHAXA_006151 [Cyclostephanos tholiformis]|uniref:Uncharacterized protein n=1 Tax=Cyclostephanos tholiformis TaxID=382380 RepID=A0ABD3RY95_9STRA